MATRNQPVTEVFRDGRLPRREMLRRVALLGIAAGATGPLLAACGSPGTGAPAATTPPPGRDPGTPLGNPVTFAGPSGELHGAWAAPTAAPRAAVLVVPDAQGLTPHFSDLTGRFAGAGYATLCVDLLSDHGNTATTNLADAKPEAKPGVKPAAMASAPPEKLVADLRAGIGELVRRVPGVKIGAVGFGMGAGLLWQLLNAGEPRVAAAVPFYGMAPDDLDFTRSPAAVLAIYPDNDAKLNESQDNADMAMMNANLVHNSTIYPKTTAGFFNDTDTRYDAAAAAKAWQATLDWFTQYL